ncbi:unnamed protein product [Adineta ricciae]|uniref:Uncharacterized protein n=1 Tax=Adineta ricciae TaxID=249248 RepID=A0A814RYY9_ADIRI|nr:unnamed protein product [Adineta ricciae]
MEHLAEKIQEEPLLSAIYVIDSSPATTFESKFYRGSFLDITRCCQQMKNDLEVISYDLTDMNSIVSNFTGMSTVSLVQALKDILLDPDERTNLKMEMLEFCRQEYAENVVQLKFIDEFEKNFQPHDAVQWYLRSDVFLHKMLTRAWRVLDPDILFKLRYFLQHLHQQIKSTVDTNPLTLYRTLRIQENNSIKLKTNQGGLCSFNEFVLLDKTPSTSQPSPMNKNSTIVHFEILLGKGVSFSNKSNEILLTMGTMFRIDKVESIDEQTFNVKLTSNDDILKAGLLMTKDLRQAVRGQFPSVRMLKLMKQKDLVGYMEYFYAIIIEDSQAMQDEATLLTLGSILHALGSYYYERRLYDEAMKNLKNSLEIYLRVLPKDHITLTPTYNNIGSIYHKKGEDEKALEYHQRAYEIQKNSPNPDMDSVGTYAGNISSILIKLHRHLEAIPYLEIELKIKKKLHSNPNSPDIAVKYHNLAGAQYRAEQYADALKNYQNCLEIELKCHSPENPTVAVTYHNMATALEELGRLQEAKEAVEEAIRRLLLTKKEDDEDLQMQRTYLERLKQKIWMKSLFSSN